MIKETHEFTEFERNLNELIFSGMEGIISFDGMFFFNLNLFCYLKGNFYINFL